MKSILNFSTKTVVCCTPDTVEFSDGTIQWTSSVAKPSELRERLSHYRDRIEVKKGKKKSDRF